MLKLSFSQIKLFRSGPLDYFYRYVLRLPEKDNERKWLDFGLGVHEVLEDYYSGKVSNWQKHTIKIYDQYKLKGRMKFEDFKKNVINGIALAWELTDLEEEMHVDVFPDVGFIGYIDVLDKKNHTIMDWKTGTYTQEKEDDYKSQLLCYAWMYWRKYNIVPKECSLFFTKNSKIVPFKFTLKQIMQFENFVKKVAQEIKWKKANHTEAHQWGNELGFFSGYHYLDNLPAMVFKIEIKSNYCYLSGSLSPLLMKGLKQKFAVDHASKYFMQKKVMEKYGRVSYYDDIGTKYLFDSRQCKFPLGMLNDMKKQLRDYAEHKKSKLTISVVDLRDRNVMNKKLGIMPRELLGGKTLRPYQMNAVYAFLVNGGFGTIDAAPGAGKTFLTAEIIKRMDTKTIWLINQKELLYQTKISFEEELGIPIGIIGDGKEDIQDVTVATIQTLYRRVKDGNINIIKYLQKVNFAIVDEAHNCATGLFEVVFDVLRNTKYRLGTTGTAFREDKQDARMFALVGSPIYSITADTLIEQGYLQKPDITFYKLPTSNIEKVNYALLSTSERESAKNTEYAREYDEGIVFHGGRNDIVKSVSLDPKNKKVLIIVKSLDHGDLLNDLIKDSVFIHGSLNKKDRAKHFKVLKTAKECIVIATIKIASEGLDVPDLTTLVNASANKSDNRSIQALGRILRKHSGKTQAKYVDFIDKSKHGGNHSWKRLKAFRAQGHKVKVIEVEE